MKQIFSRNVQKYFYLTVIFLLLPALASCTKAAAQDGQATNAANLTSMPSPNLGPNLVTNGSFEDDDASWKIDSSHAKITGDVAHSGKRSLYYNNTNKDRYKLFSQRVDVKPGQVLHFSAWVKGKNIKGTRSPKGASVYMESFSDSGYIGGTFPATLQGTFDWKQITAEYYVPKNATKTSVGVYLHKGTTGEVWFDDVEVRELSTPSFMPFLQYPNYRGTIQHGDNTPWKSLVQINKQDNWKSGSVKIIYELINDNGKVLLKESHQSPADKKEITITFNPPKDLSLGNYTLRQTFIDPNGNTAEQLAQPIRVLKEMPKRHIDAEGFMVVDGKRFFPMGTYVGSPHDEENTKRIAEGGMNTIISYNYGLSENWERYLRLAEENDLKVIFTIHTLYPGYRQYGDDADQITSKIVKRVRDNPALLAWYTNDEMNGSWLPQLLTRYERLQQLDPNHPTFQVLDNKTLPHPAVLQRFFYVTDTWGDDPYPVGRGNTDLTMTSDYTRLAKSATHGVKGLWVVGQIMDWGIYRKKAEFHPPSLDEIRNQAYQAIINGATGLIWYTDYDLKYNDYPRDKKKADHELHMKRWKDVSAMTQEINEITPIILENHKAKLEVPEDSEVQAAAWQDGNELVILLANPYYEAKNFAFSLPKGWNIKDANQGQIKSTLEDGKVTLLLPSMGSGVFRLTK